MTSNKPMKTPRSDRKALWLKGKTIRLDTYFLNIFSKHQFDAPYSEKIKECGVLLEKMVQDMDDEHFCPQNIYRLIAISISSKKVKEFAQNEL